MTEIPPPPPSETDLLLGRLILQARRRSLVDWLDASGNSMLAVVIQAICVIPIGAMFLTFPSMLVLPDGADPWIARVVVIGWYATACALLVWFIFLKQTGDYLNLYEHGFRYRIGFFQRGEARFGQLFEIVVGGNLSGMEQVAAEYASIRRPDLAGGYEVLQVARVQLAFKDGSTRKLNHLLTRFNGDDTRAFLAYINEHYPGLVAAG